ncbi:hypothetical protein [Candidatus Laterigemmans baculatus]|uniref:hypothetical protein n=1 Tax=Candidatus Laterigemmans baculatus TaxID=2770505 RepID=UPI0013DAB70F|nr:hypothetical protein [Candidatus Laterigemmans baculatus]
MRTNILRSVALSLGFCTCGVAQAQYGGYAPQPTYRPADPPAYAASAAAVHPSLRAAAQSQSIQPQGAQVPAPSRDPYRLPAPQSAPYRLTSAGAQAGAPPEALPAPVGSGTQHATPGTLRGVPTPAEGTYPPAPVQPYPNHGHSSAVGEVYHEAAAAPWVGSGPLHANGHLHAGDSLHGGGLFHRGGHGLGGHGFGRHGLGGHGFGGHGLGGHHGDALDVAGPIKSWFAGGSLLFLDFQDEGSLPLVIEDGMPPVTLLDADDVSPSSDVGFETFIGRYFGCGKYAATASYFHFNPDEEERIINPMMPVEAIHMPLDNAAAYRVRRDIDIHGLEFNFISFGIGGASRGGIVGDCGSCGVAGCGGMCRPMIPACDNRFQWQFSHGLRWLQFRDSMQLAASMAANGYDAGDDDYFYDVETQNDLLGYQLGSRADYCISRRVNLYAGGKFGIYGNHVDYDYGWIDTSMPADNFRVGDDDTVLATLGELDLGIGVRLTDCWSVTGGYRLIGATNVATSVTAITADPEGLEDGVLVSANDSLLIHGGYLGVQYNW